MSDFMKKLATLKLPFWMEAGEPGAFLRVARRYWAQVYGWITWPVNQFDPLTCSVSILPLIAWDRDVTRFNGESLELFRRRVAFAFVNARDAGSVEGFINIFARLGIGSVELRERQPGIDWDVILVRVTDGQLADSPELMLQIIRQYGRTCRRYQFEVITTKKIMLRAGWDQGEYLCYPARLPTEQGATFAARL